MDRNCPICNRILTEQKDQKNTDYTCYPPPVDHHYAERLKGDNRVAIKVRLSPTEGRIFFKLDFDNQCTDIWTVPSQREKIRVNHVFEPEFNDVSGLFQKMKTYLLFS